MGLNKKFIQPDGTEKLFTSPRFEGTYLYVTSRGDDLTNNVVGAGNQFYYKNTEVKTYHEICFGFIETIYLKDGIAFWKNAVPGDEITVEAYIPAYTPFLCPTGRGNVNVSESGEVQFVTASTTPDETWTGTHIFSDQDISVIRFINKAILFGTNEHGLVIESQDAAEIVKDLNLKLKIFSSSANPNLEFALMLEMYRNTTV